MKPKEPIETGQHDIFRSRLDQIINLDHEKAVLARKIDWQFLSEKCGATYTDRAGYLQPEAPRYTGHQTGKKAPRSRRAGYRPSQLRPPHGPQFPRSRTGRHHQPNTCSRWLQLPPHPQVDQVSLAQNLDNMDRKSLSENRVVHVRRNRSYFVTSYFVALLP